MNPYVLFKQDCVREIASQGEDKNIAQLTSDWINQSTVNKYSYHFEYMGRPIIQYPQDMIAIQELIWQVKPDLIIETGVAHGGSLIMSASMLTMIEYAEAVAGNTVLNPAKPSRKVIGIDIDIREHNKNLIQSHPLSNKIELIQGSSIDPKIVNQVKEKSNCAKKIMIFLDSNHTHDHVLAELEAYAPLVSKGSYCVVFDTIIEDMPNESFSNRPWGVGNSPKTAVFSYLKLLQEEGRLALDGDPLLLNIDTNIDNQLLISVAPQGYLLRQF